MKYKTGIILIGLMLLSACGQGAVLDAGTNTAITPEPEEFTPTPTQVVPTPTAAPGPMQVEIVLAADLDGLPIDQFFEQAFDLILGRDPELVIELGLTGNDTEPPELNDIGAEARTTTDRLHRQLLALLELYEFQSLDPDEQISYQVFEWYLRDQIQANEDRSFDYLVNPVSVRSQPQLYILFFTDSHPFNSVDDAEGYVARIQMLDEKIEQLILQIEDQAASGIIAPWVVLESSRTDIKRYLGSNPSASPLRSTFRTKAAQIEGLNEAEFAALDEALVQALKDEVFPAFERLDELIADLQSQASKLIGLSALPGGTEYYQRLLYHYTTTDLTAEEIHALGLSEIERIQGEMRQRFSDLGYPEDESISELYQRLASDSGVLRGEEITAEYERILREADQLVAEFFKTRPAGELEVIGGDAGAFYSPGSMDGSRPGRFYARITSPEPVFRMRSLAYHEGIPGHHYQISLATMADLPTFRSFVGFTGYTEGWALYAEYLAYDLGWYADDPYGDLGRLQYEALRAARLVVDTGIHARGWSYDQAVDYMVENTGMVPGMIEYEVMRYISYPAQATAYMIGKIEIQRLRQVAEEALGDRFSLSEFHAVILENGSMPLSVLESVIEDWIGQQGGDL